MKSIRWGLLTAMSLGLVSCSQTFNGVLQMYMDLLVTTKTGVQNIAAGTYDTKLKVLNNREVELEIRSSQNNKYRIQYRRTANSQIPQNGNGPIFLSGADNSQNFDVIGQMTTVYQDSPRYRRWESCTYQQPVQECIIDANGNQRCRIVYVTRYGHQWVEYFDRDVTENIDTQLRIIADGRIAGDFQAEERYFYRYETYRDRCY